jgi:2-oxo-4-hydroxy-4-carboxy-5-ureidoimidazoline decarboxylase
MAEAHDVLNRLPLTEARAALERCCGVPCWVDGMLARRPFQSMQQLMAASDEVFRELTDRHHLHGFQQHPQIGADIGELRRKFATTGHLAASEQAGAQAADESTLAALRDGNQAYLARFGFIFIVCASGKTAAELLALLQQRLHNDPVTELQLAAAESGKITKLRLSRLE